MNTKVHTTLSKLTKFEDKECNWFCFIFVTKGKYRQIINELPSKIKAL